MRACTRCHSPYLDDVEHCGIDGAPLTDVDADPLLGRILDRYKVMELLGRGAMGSVYRGTHTVLQRDFALKVLHGTYAANRTLMGRFHREAFALSKVRHTNIVSVVDFVTTDLGLSVSIMEFLPGRTLAEVIGKEAPFSPERAANIAKQIALGLAAAHEHGIIHRDVKPSNVLLMREGTEEVAKLVDFGVVAVEDTEETVRLTAHGKILGTPVYMAPEQVSGDLQVTRQSDLYALGIMLYEMLTGHPPFRGKAIADVLLQHVGAPPPPLPALGGIERLAMRLLEKQPAQRPQDGFQVAKEIERLRRTSLSGVKPLPPSAPPPPVSIPVAADTTAPGKTATNLSAQPPRSRLLAIGAAGVALAAFLGVYTLATRPDPPRVEPLPPETSAAAAIPALPPAPEPEVKPPPSAEPEAPPAKRSRKRARPAPRPAPEPEPGPATRPGLEKRLDRMLTALRGAKQEVPANLLNDVDDRYLELRADLSDAENDAQLEAISRRLTRLESELEALRYGN